MKTLLCIVSLHVCFCIHLFSQNVPTVSFEGRFWDAATGVDQKSTLYAIRDKQKIKLGDTNDNVIFLLNIPIDIQYLIFESKGYESLTFPTHFTGSFVKPSAFHLTISTNKTGTPPPKLLPMGIICTPENPAKGNTHIIYRKKGRRWKMNANDRFDRSKLSLQAELDLEPHLYVVTAKSGEVLIEKEFEVKEGLNIVDPYHEPVTQSEKVNDIFDSRTLYFDQSSHSLSEDAKMVLDSAAKYLATNPKSTVRITGYTDNVGSREPNVILSEYRARAVAGYLQQKNVNTSQIITKWEGPDNQLKDANTATNKNRRAVIQIIK